MEKKKTISVLVLSWRHKQRDREHQCSGDSKRRKQNPEIQQIDEMDNPHSKPETTLVDVHLTVNQSPRTENVPVICVTCKSSNKPILGYPVEIILLNNSSDTLHPCKDSLALKLFQDKPTSFHQLSWKTSRRTPICYGADSLPCPDSKNELSEKASKENGVENTMMLPKSCDDFKGGKPETVQSCIPVALIFSKILSALG